MYGRRYLFLILVCMIMLFVGWFVVRAIYMIRERLLRRRRRPRKKRLHRQAVRSNTSISEET